MISGAWADHIAVQSMADMLRVNINIISTLNANTPLIEPADPGQNAQKKVLKLPDLSKAFVLRTDASRLGWQLCYCKRMMGNYTQWSTPARS